MDSALDLAFKWFVVVGMLFNLFVQDYVYYFLVVIIIMIEQIIWKKEKKETYDNLESI